MTATGASNFMATIAATARSIRPLFIITVLTGSFLLFLIQPMFARMALPKLGGSPSVWNVAMLFYQAVLLGGYVYAHALQSFPLKTQIIVHAALFLAAIAFLPIATASWLPDPGSTQPTLWLLALLAVSIGPVFFVVSAQAPLMQAWFARSDDPDALHPFFLYAASNLGSLSALLAYPLLVETTTRLKLQGIGWAVGYLILMMLTVAAGVAASRRQAPPRSLNRPRITWRQRARWTVLAFVPSGLLLSTTTHLTTDVMAMPLLWVVPLAVYLASFILVFGKNGERDTRIAVGSAPALLLLLGATTFVTIGTAALYFAVIGVLLLFVVSVALHGTLVAEKPDAADLTEFYLWMSVGGALGGLFCAIIAPVIFDWGYEHPILLVAAALLIPASPLNAFTARLWAVGTNSAVVLRYAAPVIALALSLHAAIYVQSQTDIVGAALLALLIFSALAIGQPLHFAWAMLMLILALGGWRQITGKDGPIDRTRSFFGIYTVLDNQHLGLRQLLHGTTLHGVQSLVPALATRPSSYYAPKSGAGQIFSAAPALFGSNARLAFVGLGTGTLACYAQPGQHWTAFEIDPAMEAIARNPKLFSYIAKCKPDMPVVLGDARLMLEKTAPASFDILAIDAFSSDAIPLHLMTKEAFVIYQRALSPDGILLVHITNRFLALEPVVAAIASETGWAMTVRNYQPQNNQPRGSFDSESRWLALTRTPKRMAQILATMPDNGADWAPPAANSRQTVWSDDFASILPAIRRGGSHSQ